MDTGTEQISAEALGVPDVLALLFAATFAATDREIEIAPAWRRAGLSRLFVAVATTALTDLGRHDLWSIAVVTAGDRSAPIPMISGIFSGSRDSSGWHFSCSSTSS